MTVTHTSCLSYYSLNTSFVAFVNNNFHNLKGNTNLKFTNADYGYKPQPVIHLMIEKTKIGGTKYQDYFFEIHGPINKVIEVTDEEEYLRYQEIWEAEQSSYTNGRKQK